MRTRYNYGGRYSYGGRYRNGGGPLNSLMKKYENGGPNDVASAAGIEDLGDLFATLEATKLPERYAEDIAEDFIRVRGVDDTRQQRIDSLREQNIGRSLDHPDSPQPQRFYIDGREFYLEDVELGDFDEETGIMNPNVLTLPADIYDDIESGRLNKHSMMKVLGAYYGRGGNPGSSSETQVETSPLFIRGEEDEPRVETGDPPRGGRPPRTRKGGIEFSFKRPPRPQAPKYTRGSGRGDRRRPLFRGGQHGRMGRQT